MNDAEFENSFSNSGHVSGFTSVSFIVMDENIAEQLSIDLGLIPNNAHPKNQQTYDIAGMINSVIDILPHKEILPFVPQLMKGFNKKTKLTANLIPKGSKLEGIFDEDDGKVEDVTDKKRSKK